VEAGANDRGALVERDLHAIDVLRLDDDVLDPVDLLLVHRRPDQHRIGDDHAARANEEPTRRAVGERAQLIVVHAGEVLHRARDLDQSGQGGDREDRPLLRLQHHHQRVRFAEHSAVTIVGLDERMLLGQQIAVVELQLAFQQKEAEHERHRGDGRHDDEALLDQRLGETVDPAARRHAVIDGSSGGRTSAFSVTSWGHPHTPRLGFSSISGEAIHRPGGSQLIPRLGSAPLGSVSRKAGV